MYRVECELQFWKCSENRELMRSLQYKKHAEEAKFPLPTVPILFMYVLLPSQHPTQPK